MLIFLPLIHDSVQVKFKWLKRLKDKIFKNRKNKTDILESIKPDPVENGPLQNMSETQFIEDLKKNISLTEKNKNWITNAITDIGYYLRTQKLNDFDRRYYLVNDSNAPKNLYQKFPDPPLRTLHWEVSSMCQDNYYKCLRYLWQKVKETSLRREEDTSFVMTRLHWNITDPRVNVANNECLEARKYDDLTAIPFQGNY